MFKQSDLSVSDCFASLLKEANKSYRESVLSGKMTARVFARLFIKGHASIDNCSAQSRNNHQQALTLVDMLLNERADLLCRYFGKAELNQEMIDEIANLVMTETKLDEGGSVNQLACAFRDDDWAVVTDCIIASQLFIPQNITVDQVKALFMGRLTKPLVANNLMSLCYFFDRLHNANYIQNWQSILERTGAIRKKGSATPITANYYSSTLSRSRRRKQIPKQAEIDALIKHLNDKRK